MKKLNFFLVCILYCFWSCSSPASKNIETELIEEIPVVKLEDKEAIDTVIYHAIDYPVSAKKISKNMIRVQLADDIIFHWNNNTSKIKKDKYFQNIVDHFQEKKEYLVALFLDTTSTPAVVCGFDSNLVIGDLVFLLIEEIVDIPWASVFYFQLDCFYGRPFASILIQNFHNKEFRIECQKKLKYYLLTGEYPPPQITLHKSPKTVQIFGLNLNISDIER